jgi:broad specificity phosphatase PhoE
MPRTLWQSAALLMPTILLIRHGQASFGTDDYDVLSDAGRRQAERLKDALDERGIVPDRLVSGSLRRQAGTAAPWGVPEVDPRWDEYDAQDLLAAHSTSHATFEHPIDEHGTKLTSRDFQAILDGGMQAWIGAGDESPADESYPAFRGRVEGALRDVAAGLGSGQTAFVFTSGGVIAAVALIVLGLPDTALAAFNRVSVNSSVTKLVAGRSGVSLVSFNEHAHLDRHADLLTYR